ncbi:helix-turn-helix domain-containing protein [Leptolyngbya sp. 7M]|nr:helix-turn-helix domain-containing protein [Leptolyngbya sp. 7M]
MKGKFIVSLSANERQILRKIIRDDSTSASEIKIARVLLRSDINNRGRRWTDKAIGETFDVKPAFVKRVKKRFVRDGLDSTKCLSYARASKIFFCCIKQNEAQSVWLQA